MFIKDLFSKPIGRSINGVIKADQSDSESIWQELEEYVVTKELDLHLHRFFESYLHAVDRPNDRDAAGTVGIWVSGFFGSGKSHFIKILSFLLENQTVTRNGEVYHAIDFFKEKISDPLLAADIKRAAGVPVDVILFNIDSKADASDGRDAILRVFLRVFNERLGFCGEHPHIAHLERSLVEKGLYETFKARFQSASGNSWESERDAYPFHSETITTVLSSVLEQNFGYADTWIERLERDFNLTVENFAKWVREYLDVRGTQHRLVFLVDEIGQFIGQDTHLMLNLQTITENLGTMCGGRAWIVVTSQEDIDSVLGEVRASKANDFSKIQGRFKTRLSLSSANVDEVIQKRLLMKTAPAREALLEIYQGNADILKNQLSFTGVGMTFRSFDHEEDFVAVYPFAPYQFQLVQKIFETIRRAGATGLHLARGERSMLDAFQTAAIHTSDQAVGALVPIHAFYPSIESFLEGAVKSTIDNAAHNPSLKPFDGLLLRVLFLIRHGDEMRGNVANLMTLFIDRMDANRKVLRQQVEEGLQRLEGQTLIGRNGDLFFFLTNEERDISRQIKTVELTAAEEAKFMGELIFDDVLKGNRRHRYPVNNKDFDLNQLCDLHPHGARTDGDLTVLVVTPLADEYGLYRDAKCILDSMSENGKIIIRLNDDPILGRELRLYLQTEKFVTRKNDHSATSNTRQILQNRAEENRQRREHLKQMVDRLVREGRYFAVGKEINPKGGFAASIMEASLNYLVKNSFNKLVLLRHLSKNPLAEVRAVLTTVHYLEDMEAGSDPNEEAVWEVLQYVVLMSQANRQIILHELIEDRFGRRPYGWPEMEILLLVVKLVKRGDIALAVVHEGLLAVDKIYDAVQTPAKWRRITVVKRKTPDASMLLRAAQLAKEVFGRMAPTTEEALDSLIQSEIAKWQTSLSPWAVLAKTGNYPGQSEIVHAQGVTARLEVLRDSFERITGFLELEKELRDIRDEIQDLFHFHQSQKPAWDRLQKARQRFGPNAWQLEQDDAAGSALRRMNEILKNHAPYGMIKDADGLIQKVEEVNARLVAERRVHALKHIEGCMIRVTEELQRVQATPELREACLYPLQQIRSQAEQETSIAHISLFQGESQEAMDAAFIRIEKAIREYMLEPKKRPQDGSTEGAASRPYPSFRVVHVRTFSPKGVLESRGDVDAFLKSLREELESAIDNNERIEIR